MTKVHRVTMHGQAFPARSGQVLLDAALIAGVDYPHDCRAGRCGSCLTKVSRGITLGGEAPQSRMIYACQARVFSDLNLLVEPVPPVERIEARVAKVQDLTHDVVEVALAPSAPFDLLPGQYCRFTFKGYPARAFSPTAPLDGRPAGGHIHLNVKRVRNGRVSPDLGTKIQAGHRVTIDGPFGHAFLRPQQQNRLVLVGSGTGFAPMWAVAHAALRENARRPLVIVAAVRHLASFYMSPALRFAASFPEVQIVATAEEEQTRFPQILTGRPADHMPVLTAADSVYAAGAPSMVDALAKMAQETGATFYSDPFEPAGEPAEDWLTRAVSWLRVG